MTIYERIKSDMNESLKNGNKARRAVLADIIATIDKASIAGKTRVEITDALVNEVLTKYKKTVQEMIDTCPDIEKYAERKAGYVADMAVVNEYAPQMIIDEAEIAHLIAEICYTHMLDVNPANRSKIMKTVMPILKSKNCDMKVAQEALETIME